MGDAFQARAAQLTAWSDRNWLRLVLLAWLVAAAVMIWMRWRGIYWFALGDTDDNMRIHQVRALLGGQPWYDLRNYKLGGPAGFDIHWSRLVDLPIAGLRLLFGLFTDGPNAERAAVAVAPLLPLGLLLTGVALSARRLLHPRAYLLAVPLAFFALGTLNMFMPTRIDHHGWQLALLSLAAAGLADPKRARGGATVGLASAASLGIGLEMLIYLAIAGVVVVLGWIWDMSQRRRIEAYGGALAGGTALMFALFASRANRAPVCDALSPVWLSAMIAGGAAALILSQLRLEKRPHRLAAAGAAGVLLALAFYLAWPHCTSRLEGVSPELNRIWLSHVREARPIYQHNLPVVLATLSLPVAGVLGSALLLWTRRRETSALPLLVGQLLLSATALGLLFWQTRAGPGAQLLAIPGAAALAWILVPVLRRSKFILVRVIGPVAVLMIAAGIVAPTAYRAKPEKPKPGMKAVNKANRLCPTLPALRPIAKLPKGLVFTLNDLGPRIIATTHHRAMSGPYHRNGQAIEDVMHAWRGDDARAERIILASGATYVLICPNFSEATIYTQETPGGFYSRLAGGKARPSWLEPIALPADSPYRIWRVLRPR